MKNRKGFTLIEIIGAIVILGIIAIMAFATYTNSLKGFREDYYADTTRTLEKSGREFFSDNRNYRPNKILSAQDVSAGILQSKEYLNSLVDYNGESCAERSYVMVVKEGKDDYTYHGCLICEDDGYDNTSDDLYCDRTWLDPTKVTYGIGSLDDIYIYKGTSRDELRDLLELPVSYVRKDDNGNVIATRVGLKEGGDPTMVPADIDVVNTEVEGNYYVTYEYGTQTGKRKVIIYENKPPVITYRKQNIVATSLAGASKTETTTYGDEEWAQSIIVNLNSQSYDDSSLTTSRFQWNKDGRWEDFCTSDPCERKISEEMNQAIQFRIVDSKGHISRLTTVKQFRIDNTKPKCTLEMPDTTVSGVRYNKMGDNSWYVSNNLIRFSVKEDQKKSDNLNLVSGVIKSNIQISTANLNRTKAIESIVHSQDGTGFKYIGYVEDKAENFNTCETAVFKKDATAPVCSVSEHATITCTDSLSLVNRWRYSTSNEPNGTYTTVTATSSFVQNASSLITVKGQYHLYAKDSAGNISTKKSYDYYQVTYNANGGSVGKTSDIIRSGNYADLTPIASKDGYIFKGWNTSATATTTLTTKQITSDTTLYAIYVACGQGYYCKNNVKTGCPAGYYGKDGVTTGSTRDNACNQCGQGYYCAGVNDRHGCAAGYYGKSGVTTGSTSANSCNACGQGYYCAGVNDRHGCDAGYYGKSGVTTGSTLGNACNACGQGYYCGGVNDRHGCDAGYYGKSGVTTGSTRDNACNICEKGHYCAGVNDRHACAAGYYNPNTGKSTADACLECGCGSYSTGGASSCSSISAGCYGGAKSTSACPAKCSAGTYSDGGACSCTGCGCGKYSAEGSSSSGCTNISAGCYGTSASGSCPNTCSNGQISSAGSCQCTACPAGTTSNSDHTDCIALNPDVTLWQYDAAWDPSRCGKGTASQQTHVIQICNTGTNQACPCQINTLWITPPTGKKIKSVTVSFAHLPDSHNDWSNSYSVSEGSKSFQGTTYFSGNRNYNAAYGEDGYGTNGHFFGGENGVELRFRNSTSQSVIDGTVSVTYNDDTTGSVDFSFPSP